jgi:hypothetical protein
MKKTKKVIKKLSKKKHLQKGMSSKPKIKKRKSKKIWEKNIAIMKEKIEASLENLKKDIKCKASIKQIEKDNNELLMLLGECNYIVREFHEHQLKEKE